MTDRKKAPRKKAAAPKESQQGDARRATGGHDLPGSDSRGGRAGATAAAPGVGTANAERDSHTRERAYRIWEREGRPHGRALDHWIAAEAELASETSPRRRESAATTSTSDAAGTRARTRGGKRSKQTREAATRTTSAQKGPQPQGPSAGGAS